MLKKILGLCFLCLSLGWSAEMFQSVPKEKATLIQEGEAKQYCPNCGMDLVKFHKTNHAHQNRQYCSMHCLVEEFDGEEVEGVKVVDTKNLGFIDALKAFYVVGSSAPGTMSAVSQYAFVSEADAKEFQGERGGQIVSFKEAYAMAKERMKEDQERIKSKREQSVYGVGEKLYKNGCETINPNLFSTIAELKVALQKSCRLESEGQYQMVAIYLWDHKGEPTSAAVEKINVPKEAKCPICGMFVAKYPHWAATIESPEKSFFFDGVKDMMKFIFLQKKAFDKIYVSDYYTLKKIEAKKAFYVVGANVYGPMGAELIPFEKQSEALSFMKDHNGRRVVKFEEIDEKLVEGL